MFLQQTASAGQFFGLVPLVVLFPILGLLTNIAFGGRMSEKLIGAVASTASGLSFVIASLLFVSLIQQPAGASIFLAPWITAGSLQVPWAFKVDTLSVTMMLIVSGVGTLIHIYAIGYMHTDVRFNNDPKRYRRFFVYFNLFIATMMLLISSNNYALLFVGWEGVGLCSYLLISFWYEKGKDGIGNALAGKKAFVVNRIGDFGFLIAAFLIWWNFGSFEFDKIFPMVPDVAAKNPGVIIAITLFFMLGVTGKSAQIPLYVWLPDAMAGPTPVSALIHAATMVTAGVYLIARSHVLYSSVPVAQNIVALVGAATALLAATIASAQYDIKRVLAYSTISQLGFMVAAVGMGAYIAGMFHLMTHAFFKGLLFLAAGSVIQGVEGGLHEVAGGPKSGRRIKDVGTFDAQDMRNMGGLRSRMKITYWVYVIGALALAGIPPLAGFWSKDEILAESGRLNLTVYLLLTIAAFFTAFYMARQVILVFFGKPRTEAAAHAEENPPVMTIPLIALGLLSLIGGLVNLPGLNLFTRWLSQTIQPVSVPGTSTTVGPAEALGTFNPIVAVIATGLALLAIALGVYLYQVIYRRMQNIPPARRPGDPLQHYLGPVFTAMNRAWGINAFYYATIVPAYMWLANFLATQDIINRFFDGIGVMTKQTSESLRSIQTGKVRNYALTIFLGVVFIIGYIVFR